MAKFIPGGPPRYKHQKRGLNKMIETKGVTALLYDPGTGKTGTTLDFMSILTLLAGEDLDGVQEARVLVVAPLAAVDTWVSQAETYLSPDIHYWAEAIGGSILHRAETLAARGGKPMRARDNSVRLKKNQAGRALNVQRAILQGSRGPNGLPTEPNLGPDGLGKDKPRLIIEVLNIDTFASRQQITKSRTMADIVLDGVKRFGPDLVVVDESHKIKGPDSNASRLLARIAQHVRRRIILTGTVMPAGPLDVFAQWRFLEPHAFGTLHKGGSRARATFTDFEERFAQKGGFFGKEIVGFKNLDEMQKIMARNAIVARKEDSLDLPPTTDAQLTVHMTSSEEKAYRDMKKSLVVKLQDGERASVGNMLAQMMRLRQITAGHLPLDDGTLKDLGQSKANAIASLVHDTLVGEDRIVIFCLFTQEINDIVAKVQKTGTEVVQITGATPAEERTQIRKRFGSKDPARIVLVAQIKTLSLAVNELVTASHAIFGSMSQQRDDYIQARDRLNRIGQTKPVTYWHAVVPNTIDEVIIQSHQDGTDLESAVLAHILKEEE